MPASTLVDVADLHQSRPATQLKLTNSKSIKPSQTSRSNAIEKIDLATENRSLLPSKKTPHQIQALDRLHNSVTKRASVPTITRKQTTLDFSSDDQPRLSFLVEDKRKSLTPRDSTDYGDNWTTEFPSPSELLNQNSREVPNTHYKSSKDTHALDSVQDDTFDANSLEDFDLSRIDNDDSDVEAALVGLSDSITIQEESSFDQGRHKSTISNDAVHTTPLALAGSTTNHRPNNHRPTIPDKRPAGVSEEPFEKENLNPISHDPKRSKLNNFDKTNHPISLNQQTPPHPNPPSHPNHPSNDQPTTTPGPVIKPGQPAWVHDFDPAFIAEYQDIVEFV